MCHRGAGRPVQAEWTKLKSRPYILAVTSLTDSYTQDYARELGADLVIDKKEKPYSEQRCIDTLLQMKGFIQRRYCTKEQREYMRASPEEREALLTRQIHQELNLVGLKGPRRFGPPAGFDDLTAAIRLKIMKPDKHYRDEVAATQGTSAAALERSMQWVINRAWRTADFESLGNYKGRYSNMRTVPTVSELVDYYAEKIKKTLRIEA